VEGRKFDLTRLFQNLLSNGIKYRNEDAVVITITSEWAGPEWIIKIIDNGVGIAKDQQRRIFGLFNRVPSNTVSGTGLGLAVCKKIVEGLGETIWVESEIGVGSTFCFNLAAKWEDGQRPTALAQDAISMLSGRAGRCRFITEMRRLAFETASG
jgi:signal transduction histidine kinase